MAIICNFTKADARTREVVGIVTDETIDRDGEVMDYQSSKPYVQAWSANQYASTSGKSLGNVRAQHGNVAAGYLTDIQFNDQQKSITVRAKIVDNNEFEKVASGVYSGFSIGGRYLKRWPDTVDGQKVTRYTASPVEVSLVDVPCNGAAKFLSVTKADGSAKRVYFKQQRDMSAYAPEQDADTGTPLQSSNVEDSDSGFDAEAYLAELFARGICADPATLSPAKRKALLNSIGNAAVVNEDQPDLGDVDPTKQRAIDEPLDATKSLETRIRESVAAALAKVKLPVTADTSSGEIADAGGESVKPGEQGVPSQRVNPFLRGPNAMKPGKAGSQQDESVAAIALALTQPRRVL